MYTLMTLFLHTEHRLRGALFFFSSMGRYRPLTMLTSSVHFAYFLQRLVDLCPHRLFAKWQNDSSMKGGAHHSPT
jgi:hypothetical protein